jgi:hypothetical protein
MADRGTGEKASEAEQAGVSGEPPEAQQVEPSRASPLPQVPGFTVRRRFDAPELLGTWEDLVASVWARIDAAQLDPELKDSLGALLNEAAAYGRRPKLLERIPPAWRNLLGGCFLVALEHMRELPDDLAQLSPEKQRALRLEVDQLNEAFATGDFSKLLHREAWLRDEDLAADDGAAVGDLMGASVFYTVKSGLGVGQVRPAIVIERDDETQQASLFVMYKSSDVPHEPPTDLDNVPFGTRGEPGTWCFSEGAGVADAAAEVLNSGLERPSRLS